MIPPEAITGNCEHAVMERMSAVDRSRKGVPLKPPVWSSAGGMAVCRQHPPEGRQGFSGSSAGGASPSPASDFDKVFKKP